MKLTKRNTLRALVAATLPVLLASCGSEYDESGSPLSCSVADQKVWLGNYMNDAYFWYRLSPQPNASVYTSVDDYFYALLYTGTSASFPADRWSYTQSTEAFVRLFDAGQALGYGVSVAGMEVSGQPSQPLYVRYVESRSPAAGKIFRGDRIMSINGLPAADLIDGDDYSVLSPVGAGQQITMVVRDTGGTDHTVVLTSAVYSLSPVPTSTVVTTTLGRKMGYLIVKDMIDQVNAPLETAFAQFKAAGVNEIVLDLRYNGGGLVSVGRDVASYVAGTRGSGHTYSSLLHNDKLAGSYNTSYRFSVPASAAAVSRVFVLTGARTCSASEQVVNGLRPVLGDANVVTIGDTSCGKPVGFEPVSACGTTYSAVTFESVNERNEGRYFDGFAPTCAVAEDFTKPLGSTNEPLLAAASDYADFGTCPPVTTAGALALKPKAQRGRVEAGERQGMLAR